MDDLTILYVTDNTIQETARQKIAAYLLSVADGCPIVSVSQKPVDLGDNICLGEIGKSKFNEYMQILIGALQVRTKYIACVDDDVLYTPEHFEYRPAEDVFSYETNYWFALPGWEYYWREHDPERRGGMWGCIVPTELLISNLACRFEKYPTAERVDANPRLVWGEPGIHDGFYGMPNRFERRFSEKSCLIFIHSKSMGYNQFRKFHRRYGYPLPEDRLESIEPFGKIGDVMDRYFGENGNGAKDNDV